MQASTTKSVRRALPSMKAGAISSRIAERRVIGKLCWSTPSNKTCSVKVARFGAPTSVTSQWLAKSLIKSSELFPLVLVSRTKVPVLSVAVFECPLHGRQLGVQSVGIGLARHVLADAGRLLADARRGLLDADRLLHLIQSNRQCSPQLCSSLKKGACCIFDHYF